MKRIKIRNEVKAETEVTLKTVTIIEKPEKDLLTQAYEVVSRQVKGLRELDETSALDSLNIGFLSALESQKEFNDVGHAKNYLWLWVKGKEIRTKQQINNLVSLNDSETMNEIDSIHFVMPEVEKDNNKGNKDLSFFKWILQQKDSKGKPRFTTLEMKVMSKRYLGGKTQKEIASAIGKDQSQVSRIYKRIDKKILSLPIKDAVSSFGYRPDAKTPKSQIWDHYDGDKAKRLIGLCPLPPVFKSEHRAKTRDRFLGDYTYQLNTRTETQAGRDKGDALQYQAVRSLYRRIDNHAALTGYDTPIIWDKVSSVSA